MRLAMILMLLVPFNSIATSIKADEDRLKSLINHQRLLRGLPTLETDDHYAVATAKLYVAELMADQPLRHVDHSGQNSLNRYRNQGGTALMVGEILANGLSLEAMVGAWLTSPSHYNAIMAPNWTTVAVALHRQGERYIACVIFTNSLFKEIRYRSNGSNYLIKAFPYHSSANSVIYLNQNEIAYTKKKNYFTIETHASLGDFVTLTNRQQQGDIIMLKGKNR